MLNHSMDKTFFQVAENKTVVLQSHNYRFLYINL